MNKKKILYFLHLDWKWIKQRPHFIAEHLTDFYDIKVVYMASKEFFFNSVESTPNEHNIDMHPIFRLPYYENNLIYNLNKAYIRFYLKILIKIYDPDYLWLTFPQLYDYLPVDYNFKLIYDCMDDVSSLDMPDSLKKRTIYLEQELLKIAFKTFVSSKNLLKKLNGEYGSNKKIFLVRNAFGGDIIDINYKNFQKSRESYKIGFIGAIPPYFDFEILHHTLEEFENIEYHLIGPFERKNVDPWLHDRIKFYGVISHKKLYDIAKDFDCLILPLKLNDLVKSVDPVKIYEYINYNKPIISVFYDELEYFSQYVYFYSNKQELNDLLKNLVRIDFQKNYSNIDRLRFLENNSWDIRTQKIIESIEKD